MAIQHKSREKDGRTVRVHACSSCGAEQEVDAERGDALALAKAFDDAHRSCKKPPPEEPPAEA